MTNEETVSQAIYDLMEAKHKLESLTIKLMVAFSVWALVVAGVGTGLLYQNSGLRGDFTVFVSTFNTYVVTAEARMTRLESQDRLSDKERTENAQRIKDLERDLKRMK